MVTPKPVIFEVKSRPLLPRVPLRAREPVRGLTTSLMKSLIAPRCRYNFFFYKSPVPPNDEWSGCLLSGCQVNFLLTLLFIYSFFEYFIFSLSLIFDLRKADNCIPDTHALLYPDHVNDFVLTGDTNASGRKSGSKLISNAVCQSHLQGSLIEQSRIESVLSQSLVIYGSSLVTKTTSLKSP